MKILSTLGKIGAVAGALGGLILAGKSGFGKDLFTATEQTGNDPADQGEPIETTATETESPAETTVEDTTGDSTEKE